MKCGKSQDADGFTIVAHKQKRKRNSKKPFTHLPHHTNLEGDVFAKSKIHSLQEDIKSSDFFSDFKEILNSALCIPNLHHNKDELVNLSNNMQALSISYGEVDIVCYGLGHFISCMIARYQLAFLMVLKDMLQLSTVTLYDPVFSTEEKCFLKELGLDVLDINEEARRSITCKTVFFMPHCDLPLYNNLLGANWKRECLPDLIIIGNSFQNYFLKTSETKLKESAPYVYLANEVVSEIKVNNSFRFTDIFNDLSVHYFQPDELSKFRMISEDVVV